MTDIDLHAGIEIQRHDDHVTVRIPLAGEVSQQWHRRYQALASERGASKGPKSFSAGTGSWSTCQQASTARMSSH